MGLTDILEQAQEELDTLQRGVEMGNNVIRDVKRIKDNYDYLESPQQEQDKKQIALIKSKMEANFKFHKRLRIIIIVVTILIFIFA